IDLMRAFADQAVIAIENARLFSELQDRTAALSASLEQQTALGEVLRVIAASPNDVQAALQAVVDAATRLCDAQGGLIVQLRERDGRMAPRAATGFFMDARTGHYTDAFEEAPGIAASLESASGYVMLTG